MKNGIGLSVGDLNESTSAYNGWVQADTRLMALGQVDENGSFVPTDPQAIAALAQQYGIDTLETDADGQVAALRALFDIESNTTRARAEADTLAYARAFLQESGRLPTAGELGFQTGDPIFVAAMGRVPGLTLLEGATSNVQLDLENLASELSPTIGEDGILFGGASAVYEALLEQHGETAMEQAGFFDASSLIPTLQRHSAEYNGYYGQAQAAVQALGGITGQEWDLSSTADRQNLEQMLVSYDATAGTYLTMLEDLPNRGFFPNANTAMEENRLIHSVSQALNVPLSALIEQGIVNQAGVIDRAAMRTMLTTFQQNLNQQRIAVQHIDGLLRTQ